MNLFLFLVGKLCGPNVFFTSILKAFFAKFPRGPLKSVGLKLAIPSSLIVGCNSIDSFLNPLSLFMNGLVKSENAAEGEDGKLSALLDFPLALPKIVGPTGNSFDNVFFLEWTYLKEN